MGHIFHSLGNLRYPWRDDHGFSRQKKGAEVGIMKAALKAMRHDPYRGPLLAAKAAVSKPNDREPRIVSLHYTGFRIVVTDRFGKIASHTIMTVPNSIIV